MVKVNLAATKNAGATRETPAQSRKLQAAAAETAVAELEAGAGEIFGREIVCPISGEVIDLADIDSMIDAIDRLKPAADKIYAVLQSLRISLAGLTEGDAVTRRIRGKRRSAKVEMPDVSFEQSVLKELWNSHPKLAQEYMRISTLAVQMKEYKKLIDTASSEADFTFFRDAMTSACRGRVGTPAVKPES